MKYLLNFVYALLLLIATPWLVWSAVRKGKYREGWSAKFWGAVPRAPGANKPRLAKSSTARRAESSKPRIWFHAVSVGEVNLLAPLLEEVLATRPEVDVVITTTTKTGYELARKKYSEHTVSYSPLDFSWAVQNALETWQPDLLVLVELELWPNLLMAARQRGIPVMIVNGRLSDQSTRGYLRLSRWLPRFATNVLDCITLVGAQSRPCADRFRQMGVPAERVHDTGSMKFDGAQTDRQNSLSRKLRQLGNIGPDQQVFVAGSTQAPEEAYALSVFASLCQEHPKLRLILVPRHPERADEVARLLKQRGLPWCRRTEVSLEHPVVDQGILLVDTVGELGGWWGCADVGFVGGSMGSRGGQNMLEPSAFGVATCFGPNTRNFRDVVEQLRDAGAAVVVHDGDEMREFVQKCLDDDVYREELGDRARRVVLSQRGATRSTVELMLGLLDAAAPLAPSAAPRARPEHERRSA